MSINKVSAKLKQEATQDIAFSAVCHVFALRKRTRQQVTMHNLKMVMDKEGFKFSKQEYEKTLLKLGDLGLGTIQRDNKGRVKALKGITYTLQSIGRAALAQTNRVDKAHVTPHFNKLPVEPSVNLDPYPVSLTVLIDGNPVSFQGPKVPRESLLEFLSTFKRVTEKG